MLKFKKENNQLLLIYEADRDIEWVDRRLAVDGQVRIAKVFWFYLKDMVTVTDEDSRVFVLGRLTNGCYRILSRILGIKYDVILNDNLSITRKTFIAETGISIFSKMDNVLDEPIIINDSGEEGSLPIVEFERLIDNFPTTTEIKHYANSRITGVLKDYFGSTSDAQERLKKFLNKKKTISSPSKTELLYSYEAEKYIYIRDTLIEMLKDAESYSEHDWQNLIADFLLLIFPKYICVIENVPVKDYYTNPGKTINRAIDLALVDVNGNMDIIEVKKPFENALIYSAKYRDNYVPKRELSGSVVQVEKYLFHLGKSGEAGEKRIQNKYSKELPTGINIGITNPKGIVIVGRDAGLNEQQKFDFEIIKRKYANIMDVLTYDDLLRRLENIIEKYSA